jgi:hypothetical protein
MNKRKLFQVGGVTIGLIFLLSPLLVVLAGLVGYHVSLEGMKHSGPLPLNQAMDRQVTTMFEWVCGLFATLYGAISASIYLSPLGLGIIIFCVIFLREGKPPSSRPPEIK